LFGIYPSEGIALQELFLIRSKKVQPQPDPPSSASPFLFRGPVREAHVALPLGRPDVVKITIPEVEPPVVLTGRIFRGQHTHDASRRIASTS
jgi:hypothetical protein